MSSAPKLRIVPLLLASLLLVTVGIAIGRFLVGPPVQQQDPEQDTEVAASDGPGNIVELLQATADNMGLKSGKFTVQDYFESIAIPATVVERLPMGRRQVSAPIASRVSDVLISPGQSVRPGQPLFELEITDENLSRAQVEILAVDSEIDITLKKLDRLKPLASSGAVAGKRLLEIEFELKKLVVRRDSLAQQLEVQGMDVAQIEALLETGQLVRKITVRCPPLVSLVDEGGSVEEYRFFNVESISALIGDNAGRGEALCQLTYHGQLLIKGLAFESDVEQITASAISRPFAAVFGEQPNTLRRDNLVLNSIDNHVDDESQTYSIYVALTNEIEGKNLDSQGREYTHWKFKPGQRAHLEYPINKWAGKVVVPIEALVREGAQTFVFQKMNHVHETPEGTMLEFIKTPVKVLYEDQRQAVLERQSTLDIYENFALNMAFQLNLALKQAASGGGGHSHDHPH